MSTARSRITEITRLSAVASVASGPNPEAGARVASAAREPAAGLPLRPALATLASMLAFGALLSLLDVRAAAEARRAGAAEHARRTLAIVEASAAEAAYQLNAELARHVVDGLLRDETVISASLADDFGQTLAASRRESAGAGARSEMPLFSARPDGATDRVGTLNLEVAAPGRDLAPALGSLARWAACCALGGLLLHGMLRHARR